MAPSADGHYPDDVTPDAADGLALSKDLLVSAKSLQSELQRFAEHLTEVYRDYFQHMPTYVHTSFTSELRSEVDNLERVLRDLSSDPLASHRAQSSNLPFLEPVWDTAKRSRDIVRLRCAVSTGPFKKPILAPGTRIVRTQGESQPFRSGSLIIDVIADGGHSWYKVSSMTNRRLLFDLAKEAIFCGDSDDDEAGVGVATQYYEDIPLVKLARKLADTAKGHRIQTKTPTTYLVLPRIKEGENSEIDGILDACRQLGVRLLCSDALSPAPPLSDSLHHIMAPSPKSNFSEVLNVDTSLLVALASDFSHATAVKQPWFSHSHNDHADLESKQPMLSLVYPMISDHKLVCTREAAETFFHIVDTLATESEKARAYLILKSDDNKSRGQRVEELQRLSIHKVPPHLQLPIAIVDMNENNCQARFTDGIKKKLETVLNPGRSVFSYGWASGRTTLTCNSVFIKQLEKDLEQLPTLEDLPWPSIWAFPTSRPFVGVPKGDRKRVRKHIGGCSETCTCGIIELYGHQSNVTIL